MTRPYLLVVTGRPGSGKTTLAKKLGDCFCLPLVSRDQIKAGYVHTLGKPHDQLPESNKTATGIFFDVISYYLAHQVSLIAEAAFQHEVWLPRIESFKAIASIYILICKTDDSVAQKRYIERGLKNAAREYFHGDKEVNLARQGIELIVSAYHEPKIDVPTVHVDTTGAYSPSIRELGRSIFSSDFFDFAPGKYETDEQ